MSRGHYTHRVSYADTDAGGVMYHGRYFEMAERARMEKLANIGGALSHLRDDHDVVLVVNRISARYLAPARLDDVLLVHTTMSKLTAAKVVWEVQVTCKDSPIAALQISMACVQESKRQLILIPPAVLAILQPLSVE